MAELNAAVGAYYGDDGLLDRILAALAAAGKDPDRLTPGDLRAVDQFHTGGLSTSRELARLAGVRPGTRVLDVGGGLGGPARTLAAEFGADVTVLDVTAPFCRAGEELTRRTGLAERVRFQVGDALAMPFADGAFDLVWTQHATMNIEDKRGLYAEIRRVLRPGGLLAMHEVMAGPIQPPRYPLPWARGASISFLLPPQTVRALLADAGFVERAWEDTTTASAAWFREALPKVRRGSSYVGLHLLVGDVFFEMGPNMLRDLEESRLAVIEAVLQRA